MQDVMHRLVVGGQELCLSDLGDGPPILFVHGLMSSRRTWDDQLQRFAGSHRVMAPDLFGSGDSAKPQGDYSLGAHAATLRDLLDQLEIDRTTVVGHSLGGGIAMQLAYLFPERVERLVLVSSGGLGPEVSPLIRAATLPGSELVLPLLAAPWLRTVGDTGLRAWAWTGLPQISRSTIEAWQALATMGDAETRRAFLATSRSVIDIHGQTVSAHRHLPELKPELMMIWGGRDQIIPAAHVEATKALLPDSRVAVLERSGHFPHLDEPDRFAAELAAFLMSPVGDNHLR